MSFRCLRAVALPLIALLLASCTPNKDMFPPACPAPGFEKPLADLSRYRPGSQDIRDLIIRARVDGIGGKCKPGDPGQVLVTVQIIVNATRGLAMDGQSYDVPMFLAVFDAAGIRNEIRFPLTVEFARNVDNARAVSKEYEIELPVSPQKSSGAYGITAGFQLTPEELAAYRRNTRR
jgi:hypothetical protein